MKKVFIVSALVLGSMSLYAATPVILSNNAAKVVVQDDFKEISTSDLPAAISEAVKNEFSEATIAKAYMNDAKEYKLILSIEGASKTIYANEAGEWIKK